MRALCLMVGCLVMIALPPGCAPYRGTRMTTAALEEHENLVYLDFAPTRVIPCRKLKAKRLASGRLRIHAQFYNDQNHSAECKIKLKFKDAAGRFLEETAWMPIVFPRRELTQFEHTSLTDKPTDFTLLLRKVKDYDPD